MSEGIDFNSDLPLWSVEIYHRNPGTDGFWCRVFNAETDEAAIEKAVTLFEMEGLNPVVIDNILTSELTFLEGGEENGQ